jgi:type VI secretion system protein ImpK
MRLIDCFAEIMAFTVHFAKNASAEQRTCDAVAERYDALIARSREQCSQGRVSDEDREEGFFAVCCWVDETLLCSDWPDKGRWPGHQLQHRYFNTTNGGEEFFSHLGELDENA